MNLREFLSLLAFCILMQNNEGILGKSPQYIREKFAARDPGLLDYSNQALLAQYTAKWGTQIQSMCGEDAS